MTVIVEHNMGEDGLVTYFVELGSYTMDDLITVVSALNRAQVGGIDEHIILGVTDHIDWDEDRSHQFYSWLYPGMALDLDSYEVWSLNDLATSLEPATLEKLIEDWKVVFADEPGRMDMLNLLIELVEAKKPKVYVH
jgi:hypothetical protein